MPTSDRRIRSSGGRQKRVGDGEIAGVESELELPYAALHQLCAPVLNDLSELPKPQQHAMRVAFG